MLRPNARARPAEVLVPIEVVIQNQGRVGVAIREGDIFISLPESAQHAHHKMGVFLIPSVFQKAKVGVLLVGPPDLATVQRLAGHANVTTTARYDRSGEAAKR
jgi:hypothetical protein